MIYLLFNEGYSASGGDAHVRVALCEEAIRLARLLLRLFPAESEVMGLTALLLLQHARAATRLDANNHIVLLEDQDRARWDHALVAEALALLSDAAPLGQIGPYQLQARIAAVHARAARSADTDWARIDQLYGQLEELQSSPIVRLNWAVAVSKARGAAEALAMIESLAQPLEGYFYFYGLRGALLRQLGRVNEAREAFTRARALARTSAEAAHIQASLDSLNQ